MNLNYRWRCHTSDLDCGKPSEVEELTLIFALCEADQSWNGEKNAPTHKATKMAAIARHCRQTLAIAFVYRVTKAKEYALGYG